ncbi:unnamed protein product [Prorocentrum cordatum]|uniref:Uncharacterized protein n=1 Tax=Prorocentrum cordatum TaxID=2364126 RepID=A0ABN9PYK7_9DINO|nr:unnamed protein product [Polarella glacialis]
MVAFGVHHAAATAQLHPGRPTLLAMFFPTSLASRRARPLEVQPAPSGSAFAVSAALRAHPTTSLVFGAFSAELLSWQHTPLAQLGLGAPLATAHRLPRLAATARNTEFPGILPQGCTLLELPRAFQLSQPAPAAAAPAAAFVSWPGRLVLRSVACRAL